MFIILDQDKHNIQNLSKESYTMNKKASFYKESMQIKRFPPLMFH